jgi:hypothetical protein
MGEPAPINCIKMEQYQRYANAHLISTDQSVKNVMQLNACMTVFAIRIPIQSTIVFALKGIVEFIAKEIGAEDIARTTESVL